MSTAAQSLSDCATALEWGDIPSSVITAATLHLLDTIGCGPAARALGVGGEASSVVIGRPAAPRAPSSDTTAPFQH